MNAFQAAILSVIQGLTEFLPVSSSGHLVITQKLLGLASPPVLFDILVHTGTLLAVLIFFNKQFLKLSIRTIWLIFIGSLPAGLVGLFLNQYLQTIFNSLRGVGLSLLFTAGLLYSTKFIDKEKKDFSQLTWQDALIIGLFQALAILPGISRSGSTVVLGLWRGLKKEVAFTFSFYLALPAILGALVLQLPEIANSSQLGLSFLGLIIAGITGLFALKILQRVVLKGKLYYFSFYCFVLGAVVLFFSF